MPRDDDLGIKHSLRQISTFRKNKTIDYLNKSTSVSPRHTICQGAEESSIAYIYMLNEYDQANQFKSLTE